MLQHPDLVPHPAAAPDRRPPPHVALLDGVARELMPAVWGLGVQCSVLRLPADLTPRERRFAEAVEQSASRLARVLASVHDLVLAETDGLPLDPRPAAFAAIVADAVEQLREVGVEGDVHVEGEGDGEGEWDAERMAEAISYLLEAALHAGPEDAGVRVRWRGDPLGVSLTVERPARPAEPESGTDADFGARLGAGPEESVKTAVARHVVLGHGGALARFGSGRAVAYAAVLPRRPPEDLE